METDLPADVELVAEAVRVGGGRRVLVRGPAQLQRQLARPPPAATALLVAPPLVPHRHCWQRADHLGCYTSLGKAYRPLLGLCRARGLAGAMDVIKCRAGAVPG